VRSTKFPDACPLTTDAAAMPPNNYYINTFLFMVYLFVMD